MTAPEEDAQVEDAATAQLMRCKLRDQSASLKDNRPNMNELRMAVAEF